MPGVILAEEAVYGPLYRTPQRIFGIGLNYVDHAGDSGESAPVGFPGSFYKPASCIMGPMDEIRIPELEEAKKTTAEAELGIILGKDCKCIDEEVWEKYIAGYTAILDNCRDGRREIFYQPEHRGLSISRTAIRRNAASAGLTVL